MIMTLNSSSQYHSSAVAYDCGILEACFLGRSSTRSLHNDASSHHHDYQHHHSSKENTSTPSTPFSNRLDGFGHLGPNLLMTNSSILTPGKSGSSLQNMNPAVQETGAPAGRSWVAESRGGGWEGSGRRNCWRDISTHFSQVHTLRLPNFQNVSWDQISTMEAFVKQVKGWKDMGLGSNSTFTLLQSHVFCSLAGLGARNIV